MGDDWDLDEASEFLVVAATLLDLKAARLLPAGRGRGRGGPGPAGGARPALRPAAAVQGVQGGRRATSPSSRGRAIAAGPASVTLEPQYAEALPDLVLGIGPDRLLKLAVKAFTPKPRSRWSRSPTSTWSGSASASTPSSCATGCSGSAAPPSACSTADCETTLEVVARFLALLSSTGRAWSTSTRSGAGRADRPLDRRRRRRR